MSPGPGPTRTRRERLGVRALIAALATVALGLLALAPGPLTHSWRLPLDSLAFWSLLPLFAVAEILVIHLPAARSSHSHSLREVPAIAGLAFLGPNQYLLAYVAGAGLALLLWSRLRGEKLVFNVVMFALEAQLGLLVVSLVRGPADISDPRGWVAALCAVLVTDLVSAAAVTAAISLDDGAYDGEVLREALRSGVPAAVVNTCLALLLVVLVQARPEALPLLGCALLLLVVGYRAFMRLASGYSRLELLYRFVQATGASDELVPTAHGLLREATSLMKATNAHLVVLAGVDLESGGVRVDLRADVATEASFTAGGGHGEWWEPALHGTPQRLEPESRRRTIEVPVRDGLAVPLRRDGRAVGALVVSDRLFEEQTFGAEDLRLLETLAAHAVVSLDKARLLDDLRRLAQQREHEALHDPLTGLSNRRGLLARLSECFGSGQSGALLVLDVNDFKDVNDTLGHAAGDALLRELGDRLARGIGSRPARLGGDEFAVLLPGVGGQEGAAHAESLAVLLSEPVVLKGLTLSTSVSIGVAELHLHGADPDELLAHADAAMYAAKAAGSRVEIYRPEDSGATHRRLLLAGELPRAIETHAFEVWYQPQADCATGVVTGAEALLRWNHPVFGYVPPPEIIAIAERTGLIRTLTDAVLTDALHQRAAWADAGHQLAVSVNITPADLRDEGLPARVAELLATTGTPASELTLEITESGVMTEPERCLAVLDALEALGVALSVDDFGTGYSSLAYLERLPVHEVKIDRSFVQRLERSEHDSTVIRATVALAHDLGLVVVAEGVETAAGWARVQELGCELVQGYKLARPAPGGDLLHWLSGYAPGVRSSVSATVRV